MKIQVFVCLLFLSFCFFQSFAQTLNPQWVARNGGTVPSSVTVMKSVIDASGNSYIVGYFRGTVDFNPGVGTFNLTSASTFDNDLFVQKLNSDGSFAWARRIGAAFSNTIANAVALESSGVIWVTGRFSGTVDFDPGPGTANLTSIGGSNTFVLKLDNNGNYMWAGRFASSGLGNEGLGIVSSSSGDVFVTGSFGGAANFNPASSSTSPIGGSILGAAGGRDIFVAKLNSSGVYQNAVKEGEFNDDEGRDIKIDISGDVLVTGYFRGNTSSFGVAAGMEDVFIWKLNPSSLATIWGRKVGGTSSERGLALATSSGDVFVTGYFSGTADFDPGVGVVNLTSVGGEDIFVLKLNSAGVYEWARKMGGTSDERGLGIATIGGGVYTTGYFNGTADFDPGVGVVNLASAGGEDIFISHLSSSGNFVYAKQIGGTSNQRAVSIHLLFAPNMRVYLSGYFEGTTDFDPELPIFNLSPMGTRDAFIARYVECPLSVPFTPSGGVLPGASYGVSYSQTFSTSLGGTLIWTLIGLLPPGFTGMQVGSNYVVSGTTTSFGLFNFTLQVSNGDCSYTQSYQIFCSQMIFNEITGSPFTSTTNSTEDMTFGDFNKDGVLDLIYPVGLVNNCQIKSGDEIGTFSSAPINVSTSAYSKAIASFDVDSDGFVDAVTVNDGFTLDYLRGTATSPYLSAHQTAVSLGAPALTQGGNEIVLADIDNDGDMDAITVGSYSSFNHYISLRVLRFDHINNQFLPPIVADTLIASSPSKLYLDVGDIDNDGFVDVAVASNHSNYHPIWFRNINGIAFNQYYSVVPATTYANLKDIKVADFNNDGRKDIAILANNGFNDVFRVYINNGGPLSSRFNAPTGINAVTSVLDEFRQMAVADFDGDRDLDIAISAMNGTAGRFAIIRNQPTGSFYLDTYQNSVSANPYAITAGDFNRDGLIDVAVQDRTTSNNLRIFLNATVPVLAPRIGHYALRFSYANDRGKTNQAVIRKNNDFTTEGWIKLRRQSTDQYIFYNGNFGVNGFGLYVPANTRELQIISYNAGTPTDISARAYPSGEDFVDGYWNHFAFGRKTTGEWFFFWNGNNDSLAVPAAPTHTFTPASASDSTFFGWNGTLPITTIKDASFEEFRFWNTALTQEEVQEWMNLKANKDHPQSVNIAAHYDFNVSPTPTATIAFDESEKIYPPSHKKNANFVLAYPNTLDSNWTKRIPPVANFGSSKSIFVNAGNQASVLDYDPQTGIQIQFNSAVFPTGRLVVTRALEYPTDFPNPNGIPKVYWTIRNYGTPKTFDPLEMLRVRLTQMQCDSAKTVAIPLPNITNYTTYYLAKRPSNSNNPADWQIIGPPQAYGTLQYRRPGSVISDFSQLNIIHSLTPLDLRLVEFSGKRYDVTTNILKWKAYFSTNEKGLVLEKSFDALNFFPIHQQPVMFDNRKAIDYTFKDFDALGAAYYRLKLTDETGKNHYSKIIFIDKMFIEQFSIYPNPTEQGQEVKIKIADTQSQEMAQLSICSLQGKTLWQKSGSIEELEKSLNQDLNAFPQGLYIMKIQVKQKLYTAKWIKE